MTIETSINSLKRQPRKKIEIASDDEGVSDDKGVSDDGQQSMNEEEIVADTSSAPVVAVEEKVVEKGEGADWVNLFSILNMSAIMQIFFNVGMLL